MDRTYQANTSGTAPTLAAGSETGYPTAGSKATGQQATVPGPYWFHMVTEELRNAIVKMGVTPSASSLNQLATAFGKLLPTSGGKLTGALINTKNGAFIKGDSDSRELRIQAGATEAIGARIILIGPTGGDAGRVILQAGKSSTDYKNFMLDPDGTIQWAGKEVSVFDSKLFERSGYIKYNNGLVYIWGVDQGTDQTRMITKLVSCTTLVAIPFDALYSDTSPKYFAWRADLSTTTTETFKGSDGNAGAMGYFIIGVA